MRKAAISSALIQPPRVEAELKSVTGTLPWDVKIIRPLIRADLGIADQVADASPGKNFFHEDLLPGVDPRVAKRLALEARPRQQRQAVQGGRRRPVGEIQDAVRRDEGDLPFVLITLRVMESITRSVMSTFGSLSDRKGARERASLRFHI